MPWATKPRILLSAFACDPVTGSEPYVGWNWALRLDQRYELTVLTRQYSADLIEKNAPQCGLKLIAFDLPFCRGRDHYWRFIKPYYILWQFIALGIVAWKHLQVRFNFIHHLTYNVIDVPGFLGFIPFQKFIWGPVGGGQTPPPSLKQVYGSAWRRQRLRNFAKRFVRINPFVVFAARRASHVFFANRETADRLSGYCKSWSIMLETAIDPLPLPWRKSGSSLELLWTGNVIDRKALIIAIDSLGLFVRERPDKPVRLTIVGDGPMRLQAERRAAELNIESKVEFLGRMPFERVLDLTEQCDVFLFTSVQDTSGNVVLEAMSRGKAVITIDHQGAAEIVADESGVKVPVGTYDSVVRGFARALVFYADNPDAAGIAGKKAFETIRAHHSWDSRMRCYDNVLSRLLKGNRP